MILELVVVSNLLINPKLNGGSTIETVKT